MIDGRKILSIIGIALLITSCNNKNSSSNSGNPSSSSSQSDKPTELVPHVGEVRKLFDHGVDGENFFYNYCPTIFNEGHKQYIYYCSNQKEHNVTDYIAYREGTIKDNQETTTEISYVLEHSSLGIWDSRHTCDPSVIKGEFKFHGETYNYMMAYLGCSSSNVTLNETGIAVSKTPEGPWVKCNFKLDGETKINPIVPYTDFDVNPDNWGTGQPSLVSVDKKGRVLLFTTIGASNGTFTNIREYDFSNIDEYVLIRERKKITTEGIRAFRTGGDLINNADFSYDETNRRILMVKGRQPFGLDNKSPSIVADTLDVYYIDDTEGTNIGDVLFAGNNTDMQWRLIGSIDQSVTGFLRNHNACLITDEYGHHINNGRVGVGFSKSDEGQGSDWSFLCTYRIYATALEYNN